MNSVSVSQMQNVLVAVDECIVSTSDSFSGDVLLFMKEARSVEKKNERIKD